MQVYQSVRDLQKNEPSLFFTAPGKIDPMSRAEESNVREHTFQSHAFRFLQHVTCALADVGERLVQGIYQFSSFLQRFIGSCNFCACSPCFGPISESRRLLSGGRSELRHREPRGRGSRRVRDSRSRLRLNFRFGSLRTADCRR